MKKGTSLLMQQNMKSMDKYSDLATPSATAQVLERFGLSPKKAFGQNFLVNDEVVKRIISLAQVQLDDVVLEVGPGIGTLTTALLKHASRVIAVERDPALPEVLRSVLAEWTDHFHLIQKDALDLKVADIGEPLPNKMVANLPYSVAATIALDYFERFDFLESMTIMVQKEIAERMQACPGTKAYGAYTVKLSLYAIPIDLFKVGPTNFMPQPHVESMVIKLDRCLDATDEECRRLVQAAGFMADAAFCSRRKTIANSCKAYFTSRGDSGAEVIQALPAIFSEAGVDPKVRGEVLSKETYLELGKAFLAHLPF